MATSQAPILTDNLLSPRRGVWEESNLHEHEIPAML